jgi:hypothetical protein
MALVILAILLSLISPALAAEETAPAPAYRVGDTWLLRLPGDARPRAQRARIVRIEGDKVTMVQGPAQEEATYDRELNKLEAHEAPSGRLVRYEPSNRNFAFPLQLGKEWGGDVKWSAPPYGGNLAVKAKAVRWEAVDLRFDAGLRRGEVEKLEAVRIEYEHSAGGKVDRSTCWYAPKIRFAVKCESSNPGYTHEVIDYTLAGE